MNCRKDSPDALWRSLLNLTELVYGELEGNNLPVTREMLLEYYRDLRQRKETGNGGQDENTAEKREDL